MKKTILILAIISLFSCGDKKNKPAETLTIYSSRNAKLSIPLLKLFEQKTNIKLKIKTGKSTALSNLILIEGDNSPADIIFSQDASNLGSLAKKGFLTTLPTTITKNVISRLKSPKNLWVGTSGRARVFVYDSNKIAVKDLPNSLTDLTAKKWKGKLGWAPLNSSFQSHVSALRKTFGEKETAKWLKAMNRNGIKTYSKNTPIVKATIAGEIIGGLVNHYYLYKIQKDSQKGKHVKNHYFKDSKSSLINVSGVAIIKSTKKKDLAEKFVAFLLSKEAQKFFTTQNYEYPTVKNISIPTNITPISSTSLPKINLSEIDDIEETILLLRQTKIIN